jgi:hypothetical protein
MAITNYTDLQTSIADFLNRDDLTSVIPTFITLAEAQIARDLRHWRQERRATTTLDETFEKMPADFIEIRSLYIDDKRQLERISLAELSRRKITTNSLAGEPRFYTFNSNELEFFPPPDQNYELTMVYIARIDPLSETDTKNWLLTYHPDIYLYGALVQSAPYLQDDARASIWASLYTSAIDKLNLESISAKHSGAVLKLRNK